MLPGNGIAESSVAHSYFTTPDAGSAEFDAGAGSVLHRESDEECVHLLVTFRRSVVVLLLGFDPDLWLYVVLVSFFGSSPVVGL